VFHFIFKQDFRNFRQMESAPWLPQQGKFLQLCFRLQLTLFDQHWLCHLDLWYHIYSTCMVAFVAFSTCWLTKASICTMLPCCTIEAEFFAKIPLRSLTLVTTSHSPALCSPSQQTHTSLWLLFDILYQASQIFPDASDFFS
jgi:hypothetical protein